MSDKLYFEECLMDQSKALFVLSFPFYNELSKKLEKVFNEMILNFIKGENTFVSKKFGAEKITYTVICDEGEVFRLAEVSEEMNDHV